MIRAAFAAALLLGAQAASASGPIGIVQGEPFTHERTGTVFPGEIAGLKLSRMQDYSDAALDVSAIYGGIDNGDEVSVYLYRAGLPDVSLWFGQVQRYMVTRPNFTPVEGADLTPRFFAPAGSTAKSAMRLTYATGGGAIASTGAALLPRGEWLFKIRASSTTRSVAELDALIDAVLAAFPVPDGIAAPRAYAVAPCSATLGLPEAEGADETLVSILPALLQSGEPTTPETDAAPPSPVWCRDANSSEDMPIFRPGERNDGYVIAQGDAGTVLKVGYPGGAAEPVPVIYSDSTRDYVLALFRTVPTPQQALDAFEAGQVLGSSDRDGNIELNPDLRD